MFTAQQPTDPVEPRPLVDPDREVVSIADDDGHRIDRVGDTMLETSNYSVSRTGAHLAEEGSGTRITTTNAGDGVGAPRLVIGGEHTDDAGDIVVPSILLTRETTVIGSAPDAHVRLEGLEPRHATVHHTVADEYVLVLHGPAETSGKPSVEYRGGPAYALRHGFEMRLGGHHLVFARDEFADHGRPYGGREGGEGAFQRRQPVRTVPNPEVRRFEEEGA